MNTPEYLEALVWLDREFPNKKSLRPADLVKLFDCGITTARITCKKYGVKVGDPCLPKPVAAKLIAAKMKL